MVFNATFNKISAISWQSVLLGDGTGVSEENHRLVISHLQTLSHNVVSSTHRLSGIRTHNPTTISMTVQGQSLTFFLQGSAGLPKKHFQGPS